MDAGRIRVVVIGAGASGLAALKCCLDEDINATCFEKSNGIGGLWRFSDKPMEGRAGVYRTTVINTSKELLAYSTFPPPADFPNFMHHSKLYQYMNLYAEKYKLHEHIVLNTEVISVSKREDFEDTTCWDVSTKRYGSEDTHTETFDAVLVCTGHHAYPNDPSSKIPGRQGFKGRVFHGQEYRDHRDFIDRKIMVVGLGNTGGDLAAELSRHAKQLFLSTRRGAWVANRIGFKGRPFDCHLVTRLSHYLAKTIPFALMNVVTEFLLNLRFDHEVYGLKPDHRFMSMVNLHGMPIEF